MEVKFKKRKDIKNVYLIYLGGHEIGGIKINRKEFDYIYFYGNDKEDMIKKGLGLTIDELEAVTPEIRKFIEKEKLRKFGVKR